MLGLLSEGAKKLCQHDARSSNPITSLDWPWGIQEFEAVRFQDTRHMKVVILW